MDRTEMNRALGKALAFRDNGKQADAEEWAQVLVTMLTDAGLLPAREEA